MRQIQIGAGTVIAVTDGVLSCSNVPFLKLAEEILADTAGKFNNDEIYPDKDLSIAEYLAEELDGEVLDDEG